MLIYLPTFCYLTIRYCSCHRKEWDTGPLFSIECSLLILKGERGALSFCWLDRCGIKSRFSWVTSLTPVWIASYHLEVMDVQSLYEGSSPLPLCVSVPACVCTQGAFIHTWMGMRLLSPCVAFFDVTVVRLLDALITTWKDWKLRFLSWH